MAGSCESRGDSKRCSSSSSGEGVNQRKNQQKRRGWGSMSSDTVERVIVALIAGKDMEMNKHALEWALTHVVQPGDSITLLAVVPVEKAGRRALGFPIFARDCAGGGGSSSKKNNQDGCFSPELREEVRDCCYQMMLHLNNACDIAKVNMTVKVVSAAIPGAAAAEAKKTKATWVILDKLLKKEEKHCMEELHCNLVVMKRSSPKILRLNLLGSPHINLIEVEDKTMGRSSNKEKVGDIVRGESSTPSSSPELGTSFTTTEVATSSGSSSEHGTSPFITSEPNSNLVLKPLEMNAREKRNCQVEETTDSEDEITISDSESEEASPSTNFDSDARNRLYAKQDLVYRDLFPVEVKKSSFLGTSSSKTRIVSNPIIRSRASENSSSTCQLPSKWIGENIAWTTSASSETNKLNSKSETPRTLRDRFYQLDKQAVVGKNSCVGNLDRTSTVRKAMALDRNAPLGPPPLCSICQHKAPVFGKPPRWFTYAELERATDGFSKSNFLAEGGFGSVYRGILPDGQAVAVKQHKPASSQGDVEFCSEVEVLSCAQHRNVVMLIGYCIEDKRRLLVYEYICNGSLDSHLYGRDRETLEWSARQKIALGAARGLRYLHEECRVGCIVHRDMRPNNILLTHDFEPMVGDFGLARWQPDGDLGVETRVIGTFGYLAPEYAQSGQITEKADVYSFGVVLVELVTGRKAVDITRPKGQQCLTEWARPLLEEQAIHELVDPRLGNHYSEYEVYCMLHAASLCIRRDPHLRPRMSQVLRILEGDVVIDAASCAATPAYDSLSFRSRSGRISNGYLFNRLSVLSPTLLNYSDSLVTDSLKEFSGKLSLSGEEPQVQVNGTTKLSYEALKAAYWEKEKSRRISFEE